MKKLTDFIKSVNAPKIIVEARKYLGVAEIKGRVHSATIMKWAQDLGLKNIYTEDEIPWCGLFVAKVVKQAGYEPVKDPLWAQNWAKFGNKADKPSLGDILVFKRNGGGHVGIYAAEDAGTYYVLGGNQSDMVSVTRIEKSRCIAVRRCPWKVAQPAEVKPVRYEGTGVISKNEA